MRPGREEPAEPARHAEPVAEAPMVPASRARVTRGKPPLTISLDEALVAAENRSAAAVTVGDARWVFAARVATALEGGRSAVLAPERRERLITTARHLGLRPFDANLIVAIVQDTARTTGAPLGPATAERLELVQPADARSGKGPSPVGAWIYPALASLTLAAALFVVLLAWLNS
ncbi:MAG: hypothetical protein EA378_04435 [Phycisphaerales bacterium]|nr:MAG: hypothetical protein EA378_04435 [Phycisphaerales bacterium]